jgi:hypothetical protein
LPVQAVTSQLIHRFSQLVRSLEDRWFDLTRSVNTIGNERTIDASKVVGKVRDGLVYVPVRVASARAAIRDLPIRDFTQYTFIDMGSGKGRMLLVAAEQPFHRVIGVEFVIHLHEIACANLRRNNRFRQKCHNIESVKVNAADFEFPAGNLVVGLFNSFGPAVLNLMLANLEHSLKNDPRHAIVLLIYPESSHVLANNKLWQISKHNRRHHIYQIKTAAAG